MRTNFTWQRLRIYALVSVFILLSILILGFLQLKLHDLSEAERGMEAVTNITPVIPFPVGVNPAEGTIVEQTNIELYRTDAREQATGPVGKVRNVISAALSKFAWYQQLASPVSRTLVIWPGERKEQVTDNFGDILRWTSAERQLFETSITDSLPALSEGKFFPGHYVVSYDASPLAVSNLVTERLAAELLVRYTPEVASKVPLEDALTIASLLEREAYDFNDMRYISGVIWNRLFIDMPLQLDATLQYARGNDPSEPTWWPVPVPDDKYINSPFNTYQNDGLPPAPIANPSLSAVIAALNPRSTTCMFYFHESDGSFHCSDTYEEHVAKLKALYGQGR